MLSTISYSSSWSINPADIYLRKIKMRGQLEKKKKRVSADTEKRLPYSHRIRENESISWIVGKNDWPELCCKIWAKLPSSTQEKLCVDSAALNWFFLSFLRSHSSVDLPACTDMCIYTCTGTHTSLRVAKHRTCDSRFWAAEDCKQWWGKEKGGDLQQLLLGMYFRDLSLEAGLSSQRRETGPYMPFKAPSICFSSKLLLAVITSPFEFFFQKLMFIHHLSC